ncbi:MAG TPA: hypothetical protein VE954_12195 [Oligoflexus sp.]|uniref:hypothetical protein n=1 Tax=Oligoflexus sp. TaxID=1971216 RepID=UPI002D5CF01D|nr:hypothetical protein [Oligoflexus sp.]HYX33867.1 hypothetical protein [Oligoflexus sp.]
MKLKAFTVPLVLLSHGTLMPMQARAATLLASYGAFEKTDVHKSFYKFEVAQDKGGLGDFELASLNHIDEKTIRDSIEFVSRGLGFDFEPVRLHLDLGYMFSIDKFALDEIDYGISRSVLGAGLKLDLGFLQLRGFSRSYVPYGSAKTRIDSFTLTFNPYPYQQSQAGIALRVGFLEVEADAGRFDKLRGRYDILGQNYRIDLPGVTYAKAAVVLKGNKHSMLRLEAHKVLEDHGRREEFHKLIGSAMHRDAYDGGSLGIGFEF